MPTGRLRAVSVLLPRQYLVVVASALSQTIRVRTTAALLASRGPIRNSGFSSSSGTIRVTLQRLPLPLLASFPGSLQLAPLIEHPKGVWGKLPSDEAIDHPVGGDGAVRGHLCRPRGGRGSGLSRAARWLNAYSCGIGGRIVEIEPFNRPERT